MIGIIAMAVLSIDVVTLYLAKEEAQRSADAAALAAAKILSVSGITGDPLNQTGNWRQICGPDDGVNGMATRVAKAVVAQNSIGGLATLTPTITYSAGTGGSIVSNPDCQALAITTAFGVNPMVTVQITRTGLPTFFSRIWGYTGQQVSTTATAEAFNSSNSGNAGNQVTSQIIPVNPRCVKPWIVPNQDPMYSTSGVAGLCTGGSGGNCQKFVDLTDGSIKHAGISLGGTSANGVIGETFWLVPDCQSGVGGNCTLLQGKHHHVQPQANYTPSNGQPGPPNLLYVPGQVGTPVIGIPSCTSGNTYEEAIEGCDQPSNYSCGVPNNNNVADLTIYPAGPGGLTTAGVQCLIHQGSATDTGESTGQDYLNPFAQPASFPFQILAGTESPLLSAGIGAGSSISVSSSLVSLPIYDNVLNPKLSSGAPNNVTFVGFLQVFINAVDANGDISVTVINVAGCGNGSGTPVSSTPVIGTSPVPVRLITPP